MVVNTRSEMISRYYRRTVPLHTDVGEKIGAYPA